MNSYTFYKPHAGSPVLKRHPDFELFCVECQQKFVGEEFGTLKDHLVNVHGYIRNGAQVFKRKLCELCDKPALYKEGVRMFCSEHKGYAKVVSARNVVNKDTKLSAIDAQLSELDKVYRDKDDKTRMNKSRNAFR